MTEQEERAAFIAEAKRHGISSETAEALFGAVAEIEALDSDDGIKVGTGRLRWNGKTFEEMPEH